MLTIECDVTEVGDASETDVPNNSIDPEMVIISLK